MAITGDVDAGKGKQHKPSSPLIPSKEIIDLEDIDDTINDEDYSDKKEGSAVLGIVQYEGVLDAEVVITAITKAANASVTAVAHGRTTGDSVNITGVVGMTEINGESTAVTVVDVDTFTCDDIDSQAFTTYVSGGVVNTNFIAIAGATMVVAGVQNGDVIQRVVAGVVQTETKRLTVGSIAEDELVVTEDGVAGGAGDFEEGDTILITGVSQYFSDGPEPADDWVSPKESITPA